MRFIKRIPITEAMISGTQAQQTDLWYTNEAGALVAVTAWVSASSVSTGDRRSHAGKVWQALSNHSGTTEPDLDPTRWAFVAPTNRWAAFDDAVGSYVQESGSLSFTIAPGQKFDSFGCLGMQGDTLSVDVQIPGSSTLQPYGIRTLPGSQTWRDVVHGGGAFLAVGDGTVGAYSVNGATWSSRTLPSGSWRSVSYGNSFWLACTHGETLSRTMPTNATWVSIASGAGLFVAIASGGTIAATSTDGVTWVQRTLPASTTWKAVTYGAGLFVAVSQTNIAATSPDGVTWTQRTLPISAGWSAVTYGGGVFVAVASGGAVAATSIDGVNWTQRTLPFTSNWAAVAFGGGVFVAFSATQIAAMVTSPDGVNWTQRTLPTILSWKSVAYGGGIFVAVAQNTTFAATSTDGITWTQRTLPFSANWASVAYASAVGIFVAVAPGIQAAYSRDGIGWTSTTLPGSLTWAAIANNGDVFSMVGTGSASVTISPFKVTKSTDTTTWTAPQILDWFVSPKLAASSTHHVAVMENKILSSTNGTSWAVNALTGSWREVDYVGNRFIALTIDSFLAYSTNGTSWSLANLGLNRNWIGSAHGGGRYVVISDGTATATSSDGVSWALGTMPNIGAQSISYGNGLFVVTGNGKALTSPDGFAWTEIVGELDGTNWVSSAFANVSGTNTFVALGTNKAASAIQASSIYQTTINLIEDEEPVIDFWTYCFAGFRSREVLLVTGLNSASYNNATITITITGASVKLGTFNVGMVQQLGETLMGMSAGITNYSTYDVDQFGVTRITPRSFAKKINAQVAVDREDYNTVFQALVDYKDTAVIVFPTTSDDYSKAVVYGHIREWSLGIDYPTYSLMPVEVRGLT